MTRWDLKFWYLQHSRAETWRRRFVIKTMLEELVLFRGWLSTATHYIHPCSKLLLWQFRFRGVRDRWILSTVLADLVNRVHVQKPTSLNQHSIKQSDSAELKCCLSKSNPKYLESSNGHSQSYWCIVIGGNIERWWKNRNVDGWWFS
jgi:hypothetical protein